MWSLCVSFSFPQCEFSTSDWSFCRWWPSIISTCQDMQLSLCLSHPSPLAVCATVRECCLCATLPEKVAPVSCCRLLSLWVWYYPCWYPHTQPHSCPPLYPSPLFKHSVLIHMLRGIPILLPWFYSFRGCGSPHLWGTTHTQTHTHRHLWVEFACMPPI